MDSEIDVGSNSTRGLLFCDLDVQPTVDTYQWDLSPERLDELAKAIEEMRCPCCDSLLRGGRVRRRVLAAALSRSIVRLQTVSVVRNVGTERSKQDYLWVSQLPDGPLYLDAEGGIYRKD